MDLRFANDANQRLIQQLYPAHQFQVVVDTFQVKSVQTFGLALEKFENSVQLRIADAVNQSRMYLCTIGKQPN